MKTSTFVILFAVLLAISAGLFFWLKPSSKNTDTLTEDLYATTKKQEETPEKKEPTSITNEPKKDMLQFEKAEQVIDAKKTYKAVLQTTAGNMEVALNAKETPVTVNNFVFLAKQGFYDGTIFHRAIKLFMIQGGDPKGDGTGGPGYRFADEPFTGEYERGTVAMANAGPDTNGSQFFIMHADYPLPPNYVIFGKLTSGLESLDAIATAPVERSRTGEMSKPVTPVIVEKVEIVESE